MLKRLALIGLFSTSALLTSGCAEQLDAVTLSVQESLSTAMDTHTYRRVPFDWLMTETDRQSLDAPAVTPLSSIEVDDTETVEALEEIDQLFTQTSELLADRELYLRSIDDSDTLSGPFSALYTHPDSADFFGSLMTQAYSNSHQYGDRLDIISLGQEKNDDLTWVVRAEWKVLQDSEHYKVYDLTLTLSDRLEFVRGECGPVSDQTVYTRPLTEDALITDNSHASFQDTWARFTQQFNGSSGEHEVDHSHLAGLAREGIEFELLKELYDVTIGNLDNAALRAWHMEDNDAEALSHYQFDVPRLDDEALSVTVTYSRLYESIQSITYTSN